MLTVVLALSGLALTGCSGTATSSSSPTTSTLPAAPSAAVQAATLAGTNAYRRQVVQATERFATSTTALDAAISGGNLAQAQAAELEAQAAFDVVRPELQVGLGQVAPLDGLTVDAAPGTQATGLHAVERALWSGDLPSAAAPAAALKGAGLLLEVSLSRTIKTPSVIAQHQVEQLAWLVSQVVGRGQERFSHRDLVDVEATVGAVSGAGAAIEPLGLLVDPQGTYVLQDRLARLQTVAQAMGHSATDAEISAASWRELATAADAAAAAFGTMGGSLNGYGTGRAYA